MTDNVGSTVSYVAAVPTAAAAGFAFWRGGVLKGFEDQHNKFMDITITENISKGDIPCTKKPKNPWNNLFKYEIKILDGRKIYKKANQLCRSYLAGAVVLSVITAGLISLGVYLSNRDVTPQG